MGFLTTIQALVVARLDSDVWFDGVPIVHERLGDIATIVDIAVKKLGTTAVVITPQFNDNQSGHAIPIGEARVTVAVFETVIINQSPTGTGKRALDTAEVVLALLKGWKPADRDSCFYAISPTIELVEDPEFLRYDVNVAIVSGYEYAHTGSLATESNQDLLTEAGATLVTEG